MGLPLPCLNTLAATSRNSETFYRGIGSEKLFEAAAFIDRPADVSIVLDELERLHLGEFYWQLNLPKPL